MKKILFLFLCFHLELAAQDTIFTLDTSPQITLQVPDLWDKPFHERIGQKALPFSARDYEGRLHSSELYAGKVIILYFWNVWDWDSCIRHTEALNHIAKTYWKDVVVVSFVRESIGIDELGFLSEHPVHFPIIPQSASFGHDYHGGEFGTPLSFFVDREGYWQKIGRKTEEFEAWVQELLK